MILTLDRCMQIHLNEWISVRVIAHECELTTHKVGVLLSTKNDVEHKILGGKSMYRYNVANPVQLDYIEQIIYHYRNETKPDNSAWSVPKAILSELSISSILSMCDDAIIQTVIDNGRLHPNKKNVRRHYVKCITDFKRWLVTKQGNYPHWFQAGLQEVNV